MKLTSLLLSLRLLLILALVFRLRFPRDFKFALRICSARMWRRAFRGFFCLPQRVDATDEGAVVDVAETAGVSQVVPAKVQRNDCSPSIQVCLPVSCCQESRVLNTVEAATAATYRAAAGDVSMCVIESQAQVKPSDSDKADVGSVDHDYSAKVVDTSAGHIDCVKAVDGSLIYAFDFVKVDDVRPIDVAASTQNHLREVELSLAAGRSTVNLDSASVFSGSGPIEGRGDAGDGLQGPNVQKTVKWAAELTDSVPVSWLRLRAELEELEEEDLDEEDSIPSHFLLGCIQTVKRRSFHKMRSRTSGSKEVHDHTEQGACGSGSADTEITKRKARRLAALNIFNWTKNN